MTGDALSESALAGMEQRANAATPGPWAWANTCEKGYGANVGAGAFAEGDDDCETPLSGDLSEREDDYYVDEPIAELGHQNAGSDAAFIAHAREDVPQLVAEVRRLRAALCDMASVAETAYHEGYEDAIGGGDTPQRKTKVKRAYKASYSRRAIEAVSARALTGGAEG